MSFHLGQISALLHNAQSGKEHSMRYSISITTFVSRALKTAALAIGLCGMLASGQAAHGQDLFQEGGDRSYIGRAVSPPEEPHAGTLAADSRRAGLSSVAMVGNTLVISSLDNRGHKIYIIGVEGKPGAMTVHFDDWDMQIFFDVQHIDVDFAGGANFLALYQVQVAGNVTIAAGDGDNELVLGRPPYDPNLIWGDLSVVVGDGDSRVQLEESWIVGNATIEAGEGDNRVVLGRAESPSDLGAVVLGDLLVATAGGYDRVELAKCWLDGDVAIDTAAGDDIVILGTHYESASVVAGNVLAQALDIATGEGADVVGLTDNEVHGTTLIELGDDDDGLLLDAGFPPNSFYDAFTARGDAGQDALEDDAANYYDSAPHFHSFELP
jgi:hypothetical protein